MQIVSSGNIIDELIEQFGNELFNVNVSSRKRYEGILKLFYSYLDGKRIDLYNIRIDHIRSFKDDLIARKRSSQTVYNYLIVLKKYFAWANSKGFIKSGIAEQIRFPKRSQGFNREPLNEEQVNRLITGIDQATPKGQRDYLIINLMLSLGLRVVEVSRINVNDLICKGVKFALYIQGKGRNDKTQSMYITEKTFDLLMKYLKANELLDSTGPLFLSLSPNNPGARLSSQSVSSVVRSALRKVDILNPKITPHSLRHTTAVMLVRAGYSLYEIQLFMRHSSPAITQLYTRYVEEELRLNNNPSNTFDKFF